MKKYLVPLSFAVLVIVFALYLLINFWWFYTP